MASPASSRSRRDAWLLCCVPSVPGLGRATALALGALLLGLAAALIVPARTPVTAQADPIPPALLEMAEAERAFAARALVVGWKQAFLEYFADDATGFDTGTPGRAKDSIRQAPDPPKELELLWEPRIGDVAASGDLGWLTGPSTVKLPGREPRHQNYASIWKRQPDGSLKVVIDIGIPTPSAVPYADGFVRAPSRARYTRSGAAGDQVSLQAADSALSAALTKDARAAFRGRVADGGRLHRPGVLPMVGEAAVMAWFAEQPPYASAESLYAEVARSGDLGYTWGSYALQPVTGAAGAEGATSATGAPAGAAGSAAQAAPPAPTRGHYARVWTRTADGTWKVALDVIQPAPPPRQ